MNGCNPGWNGNMPFAYPCHHTAYNTRMHMPDFAVHASHRPHMDSEAGSASVRRNWLTSTQYATNRSHQRKQCTMEIGCCTKCSPNTSKFMRLPLRLTCRSLRDTDLMALAMQIERRVCLVAWHRKLEDGSSGEHLIRNHGIARHTRTMTRQSFRSSCARQRGRRRRLRCRAGANR